MGHKVKQSSMSSRIDFFYYAFRNILLVGIPLVITSTLILGLTTPHSSADITTVDSVSFDLQVSCTISSSVTSEHRAEINGGQHKTEVGETKVSTYCNDNNGYNIYAIGNSGNVDGNTDLVVNGLSSDYNIKTGVYSSGNTISSWGMKLTAGTGTGAGGADVTPPTINNSYDNCNTVPNVYTLVASRPSGTNMDMDADPDVTGSYFTTTYDIYASSVQPAGSYEGKVKYIMTHPNTNAPSTINDIDAAFAAAGKQKVYQDEDGSYYAMQDMSSEICGSVNRTGEVTTTQLADIRDNKLYYVTKLKDGHCWMTQNLDLDLDPDKPLTSNDTDLTDHSLAGVYASGYTYDVNTGIITWTPAMSAKTINFTGVTVNGWQNSNTAPYTANKTDSTETGHNSLGNYYNWTAAIASSNSANLSTSSTVIANSVCPRSWRLPIISNQPAAASGSTNEFARLNYIYNNNLTNTDRGLVAQPLYFTKSGDVRGGSLNVFSSGGYYWSSKTPDGGYVFYLNITSNNVSPTGGSYGYRDNGWSIRCIAR